MPGRLSAEHHDELQQLEGTVKRLRSSIVAIKDRARQALDEITQVAPVNIGCAADDAHLRKAETLLRQLIYGDAGAPSPRALRRAERRQQTHGGIQHPGKL